MQQRRFGKTNLDLAIFSLGTMRCLASPQIATATVEKAIALGINHFETARGYGESEVYLGLALKQLAVARAEIFITTKFLPTGDRQEMADWIDESLSRLQLDYLDCVAIHGINTPEHLARFTAPDGGIAAIETAVSAGKIRHLGFSTHGSLDLILQAIATDLFEFISLHYYYFNQRNAPAIASAKAKDLGIFIISPADKGGKLYNPPEKLQRLCSPFSPLELTYRFLLNDPAITTLSVGAANPEELSFLEQINNSPLGDRETEILDKLEQQLKTSLNRDLCGQCYLCLPCPEQINIPEILRLRNLAVAYEMSDYGQYRYRMLENAGHWFPGRKGDRCTDCGDCLPRCPQQLNIPDLLRDSHQRLNGSPRRRLWS